MICIYCKMLPKQAFGTCCCGKTITSSWMLNGTFCCFILLLQKKKEHIALQTQSQNKRKKKWVAQHMYSHYKRLRFNHSNHNDYVCCCFYYILLSHFALFLFNVEICMQAVKLLSIWSHFDIGFFFFCFRHVLIHDCCFASLLSSFLFQHFNIQNIDLLVDSTENQQQNVFWFDNRD